MYQAQILKKEEEIKVEKKNQRRKSSNCDQEQGN